MFHYYLDRLNGLLERAMVFMTPFGVLLGLALGSRIAGAAPAIVPLFALITFSGALTMTVGEAVGVFRKPMPIVGFLVSFHIVLPVTVLLLSKLAFPHDSDYVTGFILLFSIPTAVTGYIWTGIHRGNGPLTLAIILIDTLIAPFTVPATVSFLMGQAVSVDTRGMFFSLLLMVVIPSVLGVAVNRVSRGRAPLVVNPVMKPLSKLFMVAVIAINVSRMRDNLPEFNAEFLGVFALDAVLSFLGFVLGRLTAALLRQRRADTVSLTFATGMRNISAALVLAVSFFPPRTAIPVVTGILLQQTVAALAGVGLIQKIDTPGHGRRTGRGDTI